MVEVSKCRSKRILVKLGRKNVGKYRNLKDLDGRSDVALQQAA